MLRSVAVALKMALGEVEGEPVLIVVQRGADNMDITLGRSYEGDQPRSRAKLWITFTAQA